MAIKFNVATRNARLDTIESTNGTSCSFQLRSGAPPTNCSDANSGVLIAEGNLPTDWMAAASGGAKSLSGTWQDASADATNTLGHFRLFNSQATKDGTTCFMQGTITATGGGGDMEVDNVSVASGQQITITSLTLTEGNG